MSPLFKTEAPSGVVLGSFRHAVNFTMTTAATPEQVPTFACSFIFDGRPVNIRTTPILTSQDQATAKIITLTIRRGSDDTVQATCLRLSTASATEGQSQIIETGPITAWPSDGAPMVKGTSYSVEVWLSSGAASKASVLSATQPAQIYVETC